MCIGLQEGSQAYDGGMNVPTGTSGIAKILWTLAFAVLAMPIAVYAAELRTGDQPSIGVNETITEDLYIAGGNVSSAGSLRADLVAAGGNVVVNGDVTGDATVAGGAITILGNVGDDVRAAGGNILVQGAVGGDVAFGAGQAVLGGPGIGGDVLGGGGTVRLDAPVVGDVRIGGGDVYLNSTIGGNVEVYAEKLTLGENARIEGNLSYTAVAGVSMEEGAVVSGETNFKKRDGAISVGGVVAIVSFALLGTMLAQLAAGLLLGLVFRRYAVRIVENASEHPLLEVGRGLVVFIVLPIFSIILLSSVIGVPLGMLGLFTFGALFMYLWIMTPVVLGSFAYRSFFGGDFSVSWKTILLGVFIYTLLGIIPIVGWLVQILLVLLTLGTTVKVKWEIAREWQ